MKSISWITVAATIGIIALLNKNYSTRRILN